MIMLTMMLMMMVLTRAITVKIMWMMKINDSDHQKEVFVPTTIEWFTNGSTTICYSGTQVRGLLKYLSRFKAAGRPGKKKKGWSNKVLLTKTHLRAVDSLFGKTNKQTERPQCCLGEVVWKRSEQKKIARKNFACCRPCSQANGFHHQPLLWDAFFMIRSRIIQDCTVEI